MHNNQASSSRLEGTMIASLVLLSLVTFAQCQRQRQQELCAIDKACKKCIRFPQCAWYFNPKSPISSNTTGCYDKQTFDDKSVAITNLRPEFAFTPKLKYEVIDAAFPDYGIMPKLVNLELPIGQALIFDITVVVPNNVTKIHLKHNKPKWTLFKIDFYSDCTDTFPVNLNEKKHKCNGVKPGSSIAFKAKLIASRCPMNGNNQQEIAIGLAEKGSNKLKLNVTLACSCPCEHPPYPVIERKAEQCNKHGGYKCGVCKCEAGYSGTQCEIES